MKNYNYKSYFKEVIIRGKVCYENGYPVQNAVVFLEAYFPYKNRSNQIKYHKKFCGYTTTNYNGEFYCFIYDIRYYYKIKVFNNKLNKVKNLSYRICLN